MHPEGKVVDEWDLKEDIYLWLMTDDEIEGEHSLEM
jgi:hypothetical protein